MVLQFRIKLSMIGETKHRVFLWKYKKIQKGLIHTREYINETNLSLKGSIDEIFQIEKHQFN